jgi:asparagine N-glycosylation enzyme membrane subunit Stt3
MSRYFGHILIVGLQGVMVRLMLVLAPIMCILAGIAISNTLNTYMRNLDVSQKQRAKTTSKTTDKSYPYKNEVLYRCIIQKMTLFY